MLFYRVIKDFVSKKYKELEKLIRITKYIVFSTHFIDVFRYFNILQLFSMSVFKDPLYFS